MKPAAIVLLFSFALAAAAQPGQVKEVAPGVFYREAEPEKRIIATSGWVVMRDYVIVIDANFPWGAQALLADLRKTTSKPVRYAVETHYHGDHSFGNSVLVDAGATVIGSEECAAESEKLNTASWNDNKEKWGQSLAPFRLEHPQIRFRDKLVFDDGARRVEVLRVGPAHTRGDAVVYLPKERVLFAGDLAVSRAGNYVGDPGADPDGWVRVLDDLVQKDVAIVVPGHGGQGTLETLRGQRAYLADMIAQVRAGIARGISVEQLEKEIDLSRHNPWGQDRARNQSSIRAFYAKLAR